MTTSRGERARAGWARLRNAPNRLRELAVQLRDQHHRLEEQAERISQLEEEVQELRRLNVRLAQLTDVVEELLLPVASRDEEKLAELLKKYSRAL